MNAARVGDEDARGLASVGDGAGDVSESGSRVDHPCQTSLFDIDQQPVSQVEGVSERDGNPKGRDPQGLGAQHDSPAPQGLAHSRLAIVERTDDGIILRYILNSISAAYLKLGYLRLQLPERHFEIVPHVEVGTDLSR